jgi:hypothetical protein
MMTDRLTKPQIIEASSANMYHLQDGQVDMVFTSPPYFSDETEEKLRLPLQSQTEGSAVLSELVEFAASLRANFEEITRVIKPGGFLVLQTKSIRYGRLLLPLADIHCELVMNTGLGLVTRVEWLSSRPHPARWPSFKRKPTVGAFQAMDTETFMVFSKGEITGCEDLVEGIDGMEAKLMLPLWRTSPALGKRHAFGSPPEVVRRFIRLYSRPGELVVEPFCGFGTTLVEAQRLGRRSIGYEISRECIQVIEERLQ